MSVTRVPKFLPTFYIFALTARERTVTEPKCVCTETKMLKRVVTLRSLCWSML